jgi:ribosomal protein L24E
VKRDCLFCGAKEPPGHVLVFPKSDASRWGESTAIGRVCSSHTLKEIILQEPERLTVEVIYDDANDERPL